MRQAQRLDWLVTVAAALVVPSVYLESQTHGGWHTTGVVLDWAIWICFAVEFIVLLAFSHDRLRCAGCGSTRSRLWS